MLQYTNTIGSGLEFFIHFSCSLISSFSFNFKALPAIYPSYLCNISKNIFPPSFISYYPLYAATETRYQKSLLFWRAYTEDAISPSHHLVLSAATVSSQAFYLVALDTGQQIALIIIQNDVAN